MNKLVKLLLAVMMIMMVAVASAGAEGPHPEGGLTTFDRSLLELEARDCTYTVSATPVTGQDITFTVQGAPAGSRVMLAIAVDWSTSFQSVYNANDTTLTYHFYQPGWYALFVSEPNGSIYAIGQPFNVTGTDYVSQKADEILAQCPYTTDVEIADWVHDYLAEHCYYDSTLVHHGADYLLFRGYGVCQSFSEAYRLLLQRKGIPCEIVSALQMNHEWNAVRLGGQWYEVDVTWDTVGYYPAGQGHAVTPCDHEYQNICDGIMSYDHEYYTDTFGCSSMAMNYYVTHGTADTWKASIMSTLRSHLSQESFTLQAPSGYSVRRDIIAADIACLLNGSQVDGQTITAEWVPSSNGNMSDAINITVGADPNPPVPPTPTEYTVQTGTNGLNLTAGETLQTWFTAPADGTYLFHTEGELDTYGYLYNQAGTQLTQNDDSFDTRNFNLCYSLTAGQKVRMDIRNKDASSDGSVLLVIERREDLISAAAGTTQVTVSGYVRRVLFTAAKEGTYTFTSTSNADTYGYLFDQNGSLLTRDDDSGENNNFRITREMSAGETVLVGVRFYNSTQSGTIPLLISCESEEPEQPEPSERPAAELGTTPVTVSSGITMVQFTAPVDGLYIFSSTGSDDTYGYLYSTDENVLEEDDDNGENNNFRIVHEMTAGETVYVGVRFSIPSLTGTINLVIERQAQEPDMPIVGLGTTPVQVRGSTAMVQFTAPRAGRYTFASIGSADTYGYLYDEYGVLLKENDDGGESRNFSISYDLSAGQTVRIGVRFYHENTSGTINLVISSDELTLGFRQLWLPAGETQTLTFTAPAQDTYTFFFDASLTVSASLKDEYGLILPCTGGRNAPPVMTAALSAGQTVSLELRCMQEASVTLELVQGETKLELGENNGIGFSGHDRASRVFTFTAPNVAGTYVIKCSDPYTMMSLFSGSTRLTNGEPGRLAWQLTPGASYTLRALNPSVDTCGSIDLEFGFSLTGKHNTYTLKGDGSLTVGSQAFANTPVEVLVIDPSVTELEFETCSLLGCSSLRYIIFPEVNTLHSLSLNLPLWAGSSPLVVLEHGDRGMASFFAEQVGGIWLYYVEE